MSRICNCSDHGNAWKKSSHLGLEVGERWQDRDAQLLLGGLVKSVGEGRENTRHVGVTTHEGRALGLRAGRRRVLTTHHAGTPAWPAPCQN